ncbi:MAG: hypothetical protein OEZ39_08755 [Gammaproteobacteria bacterium]|nr:hypothetical protein [Gammaproteobacteria bacterium]MDH5651953.1 hypothetical protein [Gammaproteobacteria bacterium]
MKYCLFGLSLFVLAGTVTAEEVKLLAASATSSAPGSADVTCLLDDNCKGEWSPGSKDEGVDEGLYFQFDTAIDLHMIEIIVKKSGRRQDYYFQLYLNGKTTPPGGGTYHIRSSRDINEKYETYITTGQIEDPQFSLNTATRSIFIKIDKGYQTVREKPVITAIKLYTNPGRNPPKTPSVRVMPVLPIITTAKITATSILEPTTAYQPANLFDSRYDFAWSTNGKKNDGVGESFEINFDQPTNISGLLVWNGYQRSVEHYKKNGRVKVMMMEDDKGNKEKIGVVDVEGMQHLPMLKEFKNVNKLKFTITGIYSGTKYKDVLISELRLLDDRRRIIQPDMQRTAVELPSSLKDFTDRAWSSFLQEINVEKNECSSKCFNRRIRLRSNGSFVIYQDFAYGQSNDGSVSANILEGNWALESGRIRIFGKRYTSELKNSDYLRDEEEKAVTRPSIFQSYLDIRRYNELSNKEKDSLHEYLIKSRGWKQGKNNWMYGITNSMPLMGESRQELLSALAELLQKANPYYIKSSVLTDVVLPVANVEMCALGC